MIALATMRLRGFLRTGRAFAPLVAAVGVLSVLYGGGQSPPGEAYASSSVVLFPILAWQTKVLLDGEPDVQRRLARVALGSAGREITAGLLAAAAAGLATIAIAMVLPWALLAIKTDGPNVGGQVIVGLWAHVLVLLPALALGALAGRAVTGSAGTGAAVLVAGSVLAIVLGLKVSPAPWLAPPLMPMARQSIADSVDPLALAGLTAQALLWAALLTAGYVRLRRARA